MAGKIENISNEGDSWSFVETELEALQSIYANEIEVSCKDKLASVSIDLHPATADNLNEQYVKMTLKFTLNEEYPQKVPEICIRNPRGLSEEKVNSIQENLLDIAKSNEGNSMLFEIIEAAKEHLTTVNRPCGECAICLFGFSEEDVFTKTKCYHYFHSHCLARYSTNALTVNSDDDSPEDDEVPCPVCREPILFLEGEECFPPPRGLEEEAVPGEEIARMQRDMAALFRQQLAKGGIIDPEAERNRFLLEISSHNSAAPLPSLAPSTPAVASAEEVTQEPPEPAQAEKPPTNNARYNRRWRPGDAQRSPRRGGDGGGWGSSHRGGGRGGTYRNGDRGGYYRNGDRGGYYRNGDRGGYYRNGDRRGNYRSGDRGGGHRNFSDYGHWKGDRTYSRGPSSPTRDAPADDPECRASNESYRGAPPRRGYERRRTGLQQQHPERERDSRPGSYRNSDYGARTDRSRGGESQRPPKPDDDGAPRQEAVSTPEEPPRNGRDDPVVHLDKDQDPQPKCGRGSFSRRRNRGAFPSNSVQPAAPPPPGFDKRSDSKEGRTPVPRDPPVSVAPPPGFGRVVYGPPQFPKAL